MATGRVGKVALIIPKLGWISIYLKTSSHKHALPKILVDSSARPQKHQKHPDLYATNEI